MISFEVLGVPASQGSKSAFAHRTTGRIVMTESNHAKSRSWRDQIVGAAVHALYDDGGHRIERPRPAVVSISFRFNRPSSHTKKQKAHPYVTVKPDVDKLARLVLDALSIARVVDDDSQVAMLVVEKVYCREGDPPGCSVTVTEADSEGVVVIDEETLVSEHEAGEHLLLRGGCERCDEEAGR